MSRLPIISRHVPAASPERIADVGRLAEEIQRTKNLELEPALRHLASTGWHEDPELQIDDQSDIPVPELPFDTSYIQDRARIRASSGDVVACDRAPTAGYEAYCRDYLGLGDVEWVSPEATRHRRKLASHVWTSRTVRRELVHAVRSRGLRTIHPLMGSRETWQLALLLERSSRRPIEVLAPPPELSRWVNDKTEFASTAAALFGSASLPLSRAGASLALVSRHVKELAEGYARVGLKLPDTAGGSGNLVLSSRRFRGRSLDAIARDVRKLVQAIGWHSGAPLLVSGWEPDVLQSPSVQMWIPAERDRAPVVEGIFEQTLEGTGYEFVGTRPAVLPPAVTGLIVSRCWLMALLYQRLGYVGRCSFDLVLIGSSLEDCRAELIECNGRWGGTSLPMTLVHRLFEERSPAYLVRTLAMRGLSRVDFDALLEHFETDLFDSRTGRGRLVLFNPARLKTRSGLSFIALGESDTDARRFAEEHVPSRLLELTRWRRERSAVGLP